MGTIRVTKYPIDVQYTVNIGLLGATLSPAEARELFEELAAALGELPEPTLQSVVAPTRFTYNGIIREGRVIGLSSGKFSGTLVEVVEEWNHRDGWHKEPKFKRFKGSHITDAHRIEADLRI